MDDKNLLCKIFKIEQEILEKLEEAEMVSYEFKNLVKLPKKKNTKRHSSVHNIDEETIIEK